MTGDDLKAWREHMRLSRKEAAERLGLSRASLWRMERRPDVGKHLGLACAALALGLPEWRKAT